MDDTRKIIILLLFALATLLTMVQCISESEKTAMSKEIRLKEIETASATRPKIIFQYEEWYDGCFRGCQIAGDKALRGEGVGINDFMIDMCAQYCVEEIKVMD